MMAIGLVGSVILAEIVLRLFHLAPAEGVATVNARQFERIPGMFAPNQRVHDLQKPVLPYNVSIDSLGFRGPEFSRTKPADQLRAVMIGDSYVYGDFVDDQQTFPFQLEERLRRSCTDALVINGGLGGTTIVDHAHLMQRALALQPDVVILVYVWDDVDNLAATKPSWELFAENRQQKSRFPLSLVYPILRHTALWNLALKSRASWMNRRGETALRQEREVANDETTARLRQRYGEALLAFRDTLQAHGVSFVFAMFPASSELKEPSANLTWVDGFARRNGIRSVNLLPPLVASQLGPTDLYLLPDDGHPRLRGYAIGAEALAGPVLAAAGSPSCKSTSQGAR
jgi:hypothetical protein